LSPAKAVQSHSVVFNIQIANTHIHPTENVGLVVFYGFTVPSDGFFVLIPLFADITQIAVSLIISRVDVNCFHIPLGGFLNVVILAVRQPNVIVRHIVISFNLYAFYIVLYCHLMIVL
jgi:hypothetical protein